MRTVLGIVACALYAWRIYDPKESYAAFYDATEWLTGWLVTEDDFGSLLRNVINLVLLDQVEGFLLGVAFLAVLSAPIWAARKCAGLCWHGIRRLRQRRKARETEPMDLGPPIIAGQPPRPATRIAYGPRSPTGQDKPAG